MGMQRAAQHGLALGAFVILVILVLSQVPSVRAEAQVAYERVSFAVWPSAERAYAYGTRHFDATHPDAYDIDRASVFFEEASQLNPRLPFLQHQRARVAFLKGDFTTALARIDAEIAANPDSHSSYYVRGLIKGFVGDYDGAATDYETYLRSDPTNWAALNDYAWVLLKDDRPLEALVAVDWGLQDWPHNPWLLNSKAIAHYELHQLDLAQEAIDQAAESVMGVTEDDWLLAYPGNDPLIAGEGVGALQASVRENMHTISLALKESRGSMR